MIELKELVNYTNDLLEIDRFQDYCPNGLQVEGKPQIQCLISGVTASQALIDAAIERQADAILVHHGYFWRGEEARIVGLKRRRIKSLLDHDINLLAYHLPLDAHPVYGNNVQLGKRLQLTVEGQFGADIPAIGLYGLLAEPMLAVDFADHLEVALGHRPLHVPAAVSYTHLTLPTSCVQCRSRWSPYH